MLWYLRFRPCIIRISPPSDRANVNSVILICSVVPSRRMISIFISPSSFRVIHRPRREQVSGRGGVVLGEHPEKLDVLCPCFKCFDKHKQLVMIRGVNFSLAEVLPCERTPQNIGSE